MNGKLKHFPHLCIICISFALVFPFYYRKDYLPYYVTKLLLLFFTYLLFLAYI